MSDEETAEEAEAEGEAKEDAGPGRTRVVARVEGRTHEGHRPRLLRLFYPEDDYDPSESDRDHIEIEAERRDVAPTVT